MFQRQHMHRMLKDCALQGSPAELLVNHSVSGMNQRFSLMYRSHSVCSARISSSRMES